MQQEDPYLGEKARRRGSIDRPARGDGLGLATNPTVRGRILSKFGRAERACVQGDAGRWTRGAR